MQRRDLFALVGLSAVCALADAQGGGDIAASRKAIYDQIRGWASDPANSDYLRSLLPEGKGTEILDIDDDRVKFAADFIARIPRGLKPMEVALHMLRDLPEDYRMEWPRDTPGVKKPANPMIIGFFAATRTEPFQGDQTAWCAAFMCWTLALTNVKHPSSAGSKSFRSFGASTKDPARGDIVVYKSTDDPIRGHVGFFDGYAAQDKSAIYIVGGNQRDALTRAKWGLKQGALKLDSFRTVDGIRV